MPSLTNVLNSLANNCRDSVLTPKEIEDRKIVSDRCTIIKICAVAAIVTSVAVAVFSVIFLGPILATLSVISCVAFTIFSYDVYLITDNVKRIIDECVEEVSYRALNSDNAKLMHLLKGSIVVGPIIKLFLK